VTLILLFHEGTSHAVQLRATSVHVILTLISAVCLKIRKDQQGMPTV